MADSITEYFQYQHKYTNIYGKLTIFLMQVGSFFEAYQTLTDGYDLQKLSNILNIIVSKKNKSIITVDKKNPYMLGFPCYAASKFIKILIDHGYTIIIMEQVTPAPNPKREITGIYSPSTYIDEISSPDNNFMLTVLLEETYCLKNSKKYYMVGLSLIESSTGYIKLHEIHSTSDDEKISLDEIITFVNSFLPSEILVITSDISNYQEIINYLELSNKNYMHKKLSDFLSEKGNNNILKISYQSDFLKKVYNIKNCPIETLELENINLARNALMISLHYLNDHNPKLLTRLQKPDIYVMENKMYLGNSPIHQLDIFEKNEKSVYSIENSYKCLFDVINKTITPMGRRFLKNALIEPIIDPIQLEICYNCIEYLQTINVNTIDSYLLNIKDTERLERKINILTINPIEFYNWINSQKTILELLDIICKDNKLVIIFSSLIKKYSDNTIIEIKIKLNEMLEHINNIFNVEELQKYFLNQINGNIFMHNKYPEIDMLQTSINICTGFMDKLSEVLESVLKKTVKKSNDKFITVNSNERDGYFLVLSKKRAEILEKELKNNKEISININNTIIKIKSNLLRFKYADKSSNTKIFCDEIKDNSDKISEYIEQMKCLSKDLFLREIGIIADNYDKNIKTVTKIISLIDFFLSGAKIATKFFYNKPIITDKYEGKSYFKANKLRHPIVERINNNTEYIPTDIELGTDKQDGILLFGLNSAGKSTLQKSIGISVLLAQIGYFVPADKYEFFPYKSLLTRISSNDNLFKGLSSFTLEIMELTAILKRSSKNTLVIADEICKGTEHESSLIIVMTIIKMLSKSNTSFITATHLHDICNFKELQDIKNVNNYHLHVDFDEINHKLIYDRHLRTGSGSSFYGLQIAKYLINDKNFSEYVVTFSKNLKKTDINSDKVSKYNSKLFIQQCSICKKIPGKDEIPLETHHINFQRNCNNDGYIISKKYLHKNHKSNLVVLCSECHDNIDKGTLNIYGYNETLNSIELKLDKFNIQNIIKIDNDIKYKIKFFLKKFNV